MIAQLFSNTSIYFTISYIDICDLCILKFGHQEFEIQRADIVITDVDMLKFRAIGHLVGEVRYA